MKRGKAFKREQGRLNATKRWAVAAATGTRFPGLVEVRRRA